MIYKQAQIEKYLKKAEPGIKVFLIYGSNRGVAGGICQKSDGGGLPGYL